MGHNATATATTADGTTIPTINYVFFGMGYTYHIPFVCILSPPSLPTASACSNPSTPPHPDNRHINPITLAPPLHFLRVKPDPSLPLRSRHDYPVHIGEYVSVFDFEYEPVLHLYLCHLLFLLSRPAGDESHRVSRLRPEEIRVCEGTMG